MGIVAQAIEVPVSRGAKQGLLAVNPSVGVQAHTQRWLATVALLAALPSIPQALLLERGAGVHYGFLLNTERIFQPACIGVLIA